jgi:hypothetical protein
MAAAVGWAEAPLVREQIVLFPTSIDEVIPEDHEVRLLDEMLRPLEYACSHNIDFIWLAEGRQPDHSTLAAFFTKFGTQLKDLFQQVVRLAVQMGLVRMGLVATCEIHVQCHNRRYNTLTGRTLEERLALADREIDELMQQAQTAQAGSDDADSPGKSTQLRTELATLKERRTKLQAAIERAAELGEERRKDGLKKPAQE